MVMNQNHVLDASTSQDIFDLVSKIPGSDFKTEYLRSSYLSKYADPGPANAELRRSAAISKWLATESLNRETNSRLSNTDTGYNILPRVTFKRFVKHCRRIVATVLGQLNDDIVIGGFSGGASTSRRRTESHPGFKFSDKADVTEDAHYLTDFLLRHVPLFGQYSVFSSTNVVEGAVLFTVPKNSDIDRCACKEPDINMYLQKGVGAHIRRRLLRTGIDLNDQSINKDLAREGSITGDLCTLDLSSASDSISIELVRLLLPNVWFEYLNDIRSRKVVVDGDTITTEMFSSMGNGFTFELESLLFYALVRSVLYFEGISGRLSVYGDDIICPSRAFDLVVWTLKYFGFRANLDKSFATGFFRESCGGHYHKGEDVTPFYLKRPAGRLTDLIRIANQLRRWALCSSGDLSVNWVDPEIYDLWVSLRNRVPKVLWGGCDLALDTQLVTADPPNKRLVRLSTEKAVPQLGLYLLWHNSTWNRQQDQKDPVRDPIDSNNFCRKRLAPRQWSNMTKRVLFLQELEPIVTMPG
jgi:hypothetical protein